ncbi:MAG TPA: penicillin acylase family protein [Balneolaceae bacterium]
MKTFLRIVIFLLIFSIGITGLAFYWTFYRPLPDYQTTLEQPQLHQQVEIHWDSYGVPHIYAENKHDLYYSLGYVHAQDRLWQMTLSQLAAQGRFAEFFGKKLLPLDKLQRTLGFWRISQKIEHTLSDSAVSFLQAYADGVNAYVEQHSKSLPIQFTLTNMEPIPWTVTHSIALARLMAWDLNTAWKTELTYAYLLEHLSPQKFAELLPGNEFLSSLKSDVKSLSWAQTLLPLLEKTTNLLELRGIQGYQKGSNAWAISGQKSTSNAPLLAGDPHLGLNIPGRWYEVHLNLNGRNLSGATLAGAPVVILGQNEHLAWSFTNVMLDDIDFFQEAVNPQNENQYVLDSLAGEPVYAEFKIQKEVIEVKNGEDVLFTRKVSKHGPVISNIFPEQRYVQNRVITMNWTGYEVSNEIEALMTMGWAQSFKEFRRGASMFKVPAQNVIYADKAGNIARLTMANVPIRSGNPVLLRQGWDPSQDWKGFVPFDELPAVVNPGRGWVANANNSIVSEDYPYYLSIYWQSDSRYNRIRQYLTQDKLLSPEIFQQMQYDAYSLYAQDLTRQILPVLKSNSENNFETVISYLENWDFSYDESETAASIMEVFLLNLSQNIFQDEMTRPVYENYTKFSAMPAQTLMRFLRNGSSFFDNVTTERLESSEDIIIKSMSETIGFLQRNYGSEPFEWRWERLHTLTLKPPLLGQAAGAPGAPAALKVIVKNVFNKGPYSVPGNNMSVNAGNYSWNSPFEMIAGASIRRIVDLSDLSRTWSILPTGQSGNPLSRFYGDQTNSWLEGQYKFLYQDSTFFKENQFKTMTLVPEE